MAAGGNALQFYATHSRLSSAPCTWTTGLNAVIKFIEPLLEAAADDILPIKE